MTDIREDKFGEEAMSGDERWHLEKAQFDIEAELDDYGNSDLLAALRVGYALGVKDGWRQHEAERKRLTRPREGPEDYPQPTKPERVMDNGPFHGWWTSSCPVCGKTATDYAEQKARLKIVGHILGGHAQWTKRAKDQT